MTTSTNDYTLAIYGVIQALLKAGYSEEVILEIFKQGSEKSLSFIKDYADESVTEAQK